MTLGGNRSQGIFKYSSPGCPLITIITIVFNRARYLEQAMLSVLNQTYNNIEYIIIDGGSTDGTMEIIEKYNDRLDYWVSEPDNGIYHAINKGIRLAGGEIIGLLNSDDFYFPMTIQLLVEKAIGKRSCIWYGKQMRFEEYDNFCHFYYQEPILDKMFEHPSIFHPSTFVHRQVYEDIGLFEENYKVIADYDFLLRALKQKTDFYYLDEVLTGFRSGGISGSVKGWIESFRLKKNHPELKTSKRKIILTICRTYGKMAIGKIVNYKSILIKKRMNI
jgi:glycosyltransferase involved in cell wall biosynthesis